MRNSVDSVSTALLGTQRPNMRPTDITRGEGGSKRCLAVSLAVYGKDRGVNLQDRASEGSSERCLAPTARTFGK